MLLLLDSESYNIAATEVVPGNIVEIEDGSVILAEERLIVNNATLKIDQSSITGETLAAQKRYCDEVYSTSMVKTGSAMMVITAIGGNTTSLVSQA